MPGTDFMHCCHTAVTLFFWLSLKHEMPVRYSSCQQAGYLHIWAFLADFKCFSDVICYICINYAIYLALKVDRSEDLVFNAYQCLRVARHVRWLTVLSNVIMGIAESCGGSNSTCMCTHLQCNKLCFCPSLWSAHLPSLQISSLTQFSFSENTTIGFLIQEV
jgi:hypothetical protein